MRPGSGVSAPQIRGLDGNASGITLAKNWFQLKLDLHAGKFHRADYTAGRSLGVSDGEMFSSCYTPYERGMTGIHEVNHRILIMCICRVGPGARHGGQNKRVLSHTSI